MRKIFLHIGAEKTGTTTLQNTFALNRVALEAAGILYPTSFGQINHTALTAYALDDAKTADQVRYASGVAKTATLDDFRASLEKTATRELANSRCETVLLSNEHCSSRLRTVQEVDRLRQLLLTFADEIKIVFYLRNPVDFLASWYSTAISGGSTLLFPSPVTADLLRKVDYKSAIHLWESVFGDDSLILRRFEPSRFIGHDLVTDFLSAIGADNLQLKVVQPKNKSLSLNTLVFLREFNKHIARLDGGEPNVYRGQILAALNQVGNGERFKLSTKDAKEVLQHFDKDLIYIANRYFNQSTPLFSTPRLVGAKSSNLINLSFEESVEIAAATWAFARRQTLGSAIKRRKRTSQGQ